MLDTTETSIQDLIVHWAGNKFREEGVVPSKDRHPVSSELQEVLLKYFLPPLQSQELSKFVHSSDPDLNEMLAFTRQLFENSDEFISISIKALKHLYSTCDHPKIKAGEISFVIFNDVSFDVGKVRAWGIFKSERKDPFLRVDEKNGRRSLNIARGIPLKQFDKGCLILDIEPEDGYRILNFDTNSDETRFWQERFLGIASVSDDRFRTESCLTICQEFARTHFTAPESKTEAIASVQRALRYFSNNETFEPDPFAREIFKEPITRAKFKAFKKEFERSNGITDSKGFTISAPVVRRAKRTIKKSILLDKNIEVKLNFEDPDQQSTLVERGYDSVKKMYYYKFFFNRET